jgi:hypothetical protein
VDRVVEWLKLAAIAVVVVILLTRVPIIIALARPEERQMPAGCQAGPAAVAAGLRAAPGPVSVKGARLSQCLTRGSDSADVQQVSVDFLEVAAPLSDRARERPEGRAATQLGYLVGAVARGASRTQGIHETMLQRLRQETQGLEGSSAYARGERGGRRHG